MHAANDTNPLSAALAPDWLVATLAGLPSLGALGLYDHLLCRTGPQPPALLSLLGWMQAPDSNGPQVLQALLRLDGLPMPVDAHGQPRPWAEPPWLQTRRIAATLLTARGLPTPQAVGPVVAPFGMAAQAAGLVPWQADMARQLNRSATLSDGWLHDCAALGASHTPPFNAWVPPGAQAGATVQLPVTLLNLGQDGVGDDGLPPADGAAGTVGQAATLTLYRLHQPGADLGMAPAPASALLLRSGPEWDESLALVRAEVAALLGADAMLRLRDTAIAWDLALPGNRPLGEVSGPSASAALALGVLWLLREAVPAPPQAALVRLTPADLAHCAVSAALGLGMALLPVGGTLDKGAALHAMAQALASHPDRARLVLHVSHLQPLPAAPAPGQVPHQDWPTLPALLHHLADQADPLSTDQATLLQALLAPGEASPALHDPELLQRVYSAPVHTLRQYLLHAWARFERQLGGRVYQRFVPLAVRPDPASPAATEDPRLLDGLNGTFDGGVQELLRRLDGSGVEAYLLRGVPGSGKTTLLRHHLQWSARQALHALGGLAGADTDPSPRPELPVVLWLGDLRPEVTDIAGWVQQQLAVHPPALFELLQGRGDWARRGLRARLMLDGLNELPVAHADQRPQRAAQVVQAVLAHLRARHGQGTPLPLLLSIRSQHAVRMADLKLLTADLLPWDDAQIRHYLALRFAGEADRGESRHCKLAAVPQALALCAVPLYLALQCDLLDDLAQHPDLPPPGHRAELYAAWLWHTLRRALKADERQGPNDPSSPWHEPPGAGPDAVLLTPADRALLMHDATWRTGRLRPPPLQGQLLRSLTQQAEAQWWGDDLVSDAARVDAGAATAEQTFGLRAWNTVATHLPSPLRERFGRAAAALGLVDLDDAFTRWRFAHHSWGEYLASCALLRAGPPASGRLLKRLDAVPLPCDSDEAQVQALAGGGPAWRAVPEAVWQQLLREPLSVDLTVLVDSFYDPAARMNIPFEYRLKHVESNTLATFFRAGALRIDRAAHRCRVDWERLAVGLRTDDALGLPPSGWRSRLAAGFQSLVHKGLPPAFKPSLRDWLDCRVREGQLPADLPARLLADEGRLDLPANSEGAEVLGLALLGLGDADLQAWLTELLADEAHTLWAALDRVLPALKARLEPQDAWGEQAAPGTRLAPHPLLQHLRRVLLLTCLDAGADSHAGARASGQLGLLDAAEPAGLPRVLRRRWKQLRTAAFQGIGQRLAWRLQAGLMLGQLGDNLRYERVACGPTPGDWGLRPRRALWAPVGDPEEYTGHDIGSAPSEGDASEQPRWRAQLAGYQACRLPLTVGEWLCFHRTTAGQAHDWTMADDPAYNKPLLPVTGINQHAMRAYADWADALFADWRTAEAKAHDRPLRLALPTEVQWEAAARAPALPPTVGEAWAERLQRLLGRSPALTPSRAAGGTAAEEGLAGLRQDTAFNHANTRWLRPSPVGSFGRSTSPRGLADVRGNVWEFCSSVLTFEQRARGWAGDADRLTAGQPAPRASDRDRALRGGAFDDTADGCRAAFRLLNLPVVHDGDLGVRLVRVWLPHSEP